MKTHYFALGILEHSFESEVIALIYFLRSSLPYSHAATQTWHFQYPLLPNRYTSSIPQINFIKPKIVAILIRQSKSQKSTRLDKIPKNARYPSTPSYEQYSSIVWWTPISFWIESMSRQPPFPIISKKAPLSKQSLISILLTHVKIFRTNHQVNDRWVPR